MLIAYAAKSRIKRVNYHPPSKIHARSTGYQSITSLKQIFRRDNCQHKNYICSSAFHIFNLIFAVASASPPQPYQLRYTKWFHK